MVEDSPTVVFLTNLDSPIHSIAEEILEKEFKVKHVFTTGRSFDDGVLRELADANAIFVRTGVVTREVMDAAPDLRVITVHGTGMDRVDLETAEQRGILVTNTPLANIVAVAEHTITLILSLIGKVPTLDRLVRERRWEESRFMRRQLMNMTVGILGFGNVGTGVAKRLKAFETKVVSYDPYVPLERFEELGVKPVDLETLLRQSDLITIHVPLTRYTRHMIGERELRMMKKEAFIVNTSRGAVIEESALCQALQDKWVSGSALDVFEEEPLDPDNPLLGLDNTVLTPHVAGSAKESVKRMAETAARDIRRVLNDEKPLHEYRRDLLPYPV